ncbi:MAG: HlyD family efflux transporter periplasmic adaptor subunit [Planctomycetota bacterium]|nr:HlyD family efflux transporter periplasmic adaptor subunit [Planctomycetota bacterium]
MSNSSVQEVRDKIIQLAREIEEHSRSKMPPREFFNEFLKRVVGAVGARAGVVWLRNDANRLELLHEIGLANTGFHENPNAMSANQQFLTEVLSNGQACTYHPAETSEKLPTEDMLVLAALQKNKEVVGVVEIFQRHDTPAQARPGFLQFVEQMTGYACRYLDNQGKEDPNSSLAVSKIAEDFEQFVLQLHKSLDVKEVAFTAANDGRLLVGCDRMSVAVLDGRKTVIRAISGQDSVNHRANLVRRMTKLASHVIRTNEKMEYTGKVDHLAPKVERALADFVQESGSRMVTVIPIFQPDPVIEKEDSNGRPKEKVRKAVGGIIIEQVAESQPKAGVLEKGDLVSDHVGAAIYNAKQYNRLFLMPLWRGLGKVFGFLEGRNGLKAALIVFALAGAIAALVMVPWDYRVEGQGRMMPVIQKDVFVPWDGEVVEIMVDSGQHVEEGQLLLQIKNPDLKTQRTAAIGEYRSKEALLRTINNELTRNLRPAEPNKRNELEGQMKQTQEEMASLAEQIAIIEERIASLSVKAPISGVIATFQLEQLLLNRPVRRGEVLLEIKHDDGEWQLELDVEEKRMGHFLDAVKANNNDLSLPVEFVLATDSESKFEGKVSKVSTRANSSQEAGSVVMVFCEFKKDQLPRQPRIGAEVRAKINCGEKSLGYVLFGDVVEFVQKYFWL